MTEPLATDLVARWKVTSYCLCPTSKNQGHFERNDEGVWVLYADHAAVIERLRRQVRELQEEVHESQRGGLSWQEATR